MKKACVIGWPIAHSRSPLIHNFWLRQYEIDGSYERLPVPPENLSGFLRDLKVNGYMGCNVTIPHKEKAVSAMDEVDDVVRQTGALNTVYFQAGKTCATSTDGEGFIQNLLSHIPGFFFKEKHITILGAGGSAKAITASLLHHNVKSITIVNRTQKRAEEMRDIFGEKIKSGPLMSNCDVLINTTPLGMTGQPNLTIDLSVLSENAIVADIVYVPLQTHFLKNAQERGLRTVPGLGMLLHQAVRGFELWFDIRPVVTPELYRKVARDIDPEYQS